MDSKRIKTILVAMRPGQWTKNLSVFAAIIFNGKFFDWPFFSKTLIVFVVFCLLSSASYLINDVIDAPLDRKHPFKKERPVARGDLSEPSAVKMALGLILLGSSISVFFGLPFFIFCLSFIALHLVYSSYLKRQVIWDIVAISASFIMRVLAGEIATGYHLQIWLLLTVIFLSLFIASGKRRSELVIEGAKTRHVLSRYQRSLLNFYFTVFAVATLLTYALFTYFMEPLQFSPKYQQFFLKYFPMALGRKWMVLTVFPVIFGIMRFAQLILEKQEEGERPDKLLTSDLPLSFTILIWGLMTIAIIYVP